jgi:hypothetical protein
MTTIFIVITQRTSDLSQNELEECNIFQFSVKHFAAVWGKCVLAVTGRVENVSQEVLRI